MLFSSLIFLYGFLPACLLLYYVIPSMTWRNYLLLAVSLVFYGAGEPKWVFLLVGTTLLDYLFGLAIARFGARSSGARWMVALSAIINIGALVYFKYADFAISNLNLLPWLNIAHLGVALPIGISFFTFQKLTYVVDVYKGEEAPQRSFSKLLLYVSLFPQLIAGPILRYNEISGQLDHRELSAEKFAYGVARFAGGLGKKVLLANYAGAVADRLLGGDLATANGGMIWLGVLMYTFQIYFDFSGYSDMAIGLGAMFGFRYGENFNYPYISVSVTDFWRRWHISLSTFFRDYVYIPLGGKYRHQARNILVVWLLTGLWHGASWNFIVWGGYYAVLLILEKVVLLKLLKRLPKFVGWIYAMLAVMAGWTCFYFVSARRLLAAVKAMLGLNGAPFFSEGLWVLLTENALLIAVCAIVSAPVLQWVKGKLLKGGWEKCSVVQGALIAAGSATLIILSTVSLTGSGFNPFLYFRF